MLTLIKLGGSLITDKQLARTPRRQVLERIASEIAAAQKENSQLELLIGHGSGSFGHVPASQYGTRDGVRTSNQWRGFFEVWKDAAALNHLVMDALAKAGLAAISFPPSASVVANSGLVDSWDLSPIELAIKAGLIPVVYGDVVFDRQRGGTILSTEDLFSYLAGHLQPQRILLAGIEPGVWADYPKCTRLQLEITTTSLERMGKALGGSTATDVTGGMASKVRQGLKMAELLPGLEVRIFSGQEPEKVYQALSGQPVGTLLQP